MTNSSKLSRRDFARGTALAAAVAAVLPTGLLAQSTSTQAKPAENPAPAAGPDLSPAAKAEAQQCYLAVMQKYGDRFNDAQKKDIARLLELQQKAIEAVRSYALENGDGPAVAFKVSD
ncbi:MAG: hypothetical protein ABSD20_21825 [Terriglobales bacterium]|jgi:hypothetical protein